MATCFKCEVKLEEKQNQEFSLFKPIHHHCHFILTVCSDCVGKLNPPLPKCTCSASALAVTTIPLNHGNKGGTKKLDLIPLSHQEQED